MHQSATASIQRKINAEVFDALQYSVNSCVEEQITPSNNSTETQDSTTSVNQSLGTPTLAPEGRRFIFNQSQPVTTHNDADYALLKSISELAPRVFNKAAVLDLASKKSNDSQLGLRLNNLLNRLTLSGYIEIWDQLPTKAPTFDIEEQPFMPEVMRRYYQETGHLSNYRHGTSGLNIIQKEIIHLLDGEHNQEQLQAHLRQAYDAERIRLLDQDNQALTKDKVDDSLASHLRQALELFKLNGLLYKK